MVVNFNDVLNSNFMVALQAISSIIMVLWLIDSFRGYQIKKRSGFDFRPIRKRNALIILSTFILITIFMIGDYYLETGFSSAIVLVLKITWAIACFVWLTWKIYSWRNGLG